MFVFDLEATGLKFNSRFLVGVGLTPSKNNHWDTSFNALDFVSIIINKLTQGHKVWGHNIICFDLPFLVYKEREEAGTDDLLKALKYHSHLIFDSLLISRRNNHKMSGHSLEGYADIFAYEYGFNVKKVQVEEGKWNKENLNLLKERCRNDVLLSEKLVEFIGDRDYLALDDNHANIQRAYPQIIDMLASGYPMDRTIMRYSRNVLFTELFKARKIFVGDSGININSAQQISDRLTDLYGRGLPLGPPSEKTKRASRLSNEKVLDRLNLTMPLVTYLKKYKKTKGLYDYFKKDKKSKKSFYNSILYNKYLNGHRGHSSLGLFSSRTYRNQFAEPPLNQMATKIRNVVNVDPKTHSLVGIDIKSLEYRVLGRVLRELGFDRIWDETEKNLCPKQQTVEVFKDEMDEIEALRGEEFPHKDRLALGKTINYAILYGSSASGLTKNTLGLGEESVQTIQNKINERFEGVEVFKKYLAGEIDRKKGTLTNLYGLEVPSPAYCSVNTFAQSSGSEYAYMLLFLLPPLIEEILQDSLDNQVDVKATPIIYNHDEIQVVVNLPLKTMNILKGCFISELKDTARENFEKVTGHEYLADIDVMIGEGWHETH